MRLTIGKHSIEFTPRSIHELNQRLDSLAARNFPTHMNLEVAAHAQMPPPSDMEVMARQIQRLKEQNKMLTEEVGRKSNGITNLGRIQFNKTCLFHRRSEQKCRGNWPSSGPKQRLMGVKIGEMSLITYSSNNC